MPTLVVKLTCKKVIFQQYSTAVLITQLAFVTFPEYDREQCHSFFYIFFYSEPRSERVAVATE